LDGIERTPQIISLLRRSIGGIAEKWLSYSYVRRIVKRELGGDDLSKEMWV